MTTINDLDMEGLRNAVETWAENEPAQSRAAAWALADHGHWLDDSEFCRWCLVVDDDDEENPLVAVIWSHAANMLRNSQLTGSPSELAMLRFCTDLALDANDWQSLDDDNRSILLQAARVALKRS